jgi:hypothetical protein
MNESKKVIAEEYSFYDEIKLKPLQDNHLNELIKIIDESVHEQKKLLEKAMEVLKQSQFKNINAPVPSLVECQECPR